MGSTGFSAAAGKPTLIEGLRDVNAMFATCTMWRSGVVSNIWETREVFNQERQL
jgi:hypothetical protein